MLTALVEWEQATRRPISEMPTESVAHSQTRHFAAVTQHKQGQPAPRWEILLAVHTGRFWGGGLADRYRFGIACLAFNGICVWLAPPAIYLAVVLLWDTSLDGETGDSDNKNEPAARLDLPNSIYPSRLVHTPTTSPGCMLCIRETYDPRIEWPCDSLCPSTTPRRQCEPPIRSHEPPAAAFLLASDM